MRTRSIRIKKFHKISLIVSYTVLLYISGIPSRNNAKDLLQKTQKYNDMTK